jgi:hypothetical protein
LGKKGADSAFWQCLRDFLRTTDFQRANGTRQADWRTHNRRKRRTNEIWVLIYHKKSATCGLTTVSGPTRNPANTIALPELDDYSEELLKMKKTKAKSSGRKLKLELDPELTKRICALLADGCSIRTSCEATGTSQSTFFEYLRRAAPEHPDHARRFLEFSQSVSRARGMGKATLIGIISRAARTDWRAAVALLERVSPSEYGRVARGEEPDGETPLAPIIHVTIQRDEATDKARKLFGTPPPNRSRTRIL